MAPVPSAGAGGSPSGGGGEGGEGGGEGGAGGGGGGEGGVSTVTTLMKGSDSFSGLSLDSWGVTAARGRRGSAGGGARVRHCMCRLSS